MKVPKKRIAFFHIAIVFSSIISCQKSGGKTQKETISKPKLVVFDSVTAVKKQVDPSEIVVRRLEAMKIAFEEKSPEKMADFFDFPTSSFLFVRRDSVLKKRLESNNNKISKKDFLELASIRNTADHPSLFKLLNSLEINALKKANYVERILEVDGDECYYMYKIEIDENILILSYGSNSNMKYSEEGTCSEKHYFLHFTITNDEVKFQKLDAAG